MKKRKKIIFLNSIFIPFLKLKKIEPYLESSFHLDLKNGIDLNLYRNSGEFWCESRCKNPIFR